MKLNFLSEVSALMKTYLQIQNNILQNCRKIKFMCFEDSNQKTLAWLQWYWTSYWLKFTGFFFYYYFLSEYFCIKFDSVNGRLLLLIYKTQCIQLFQVLLRTSCFYIKRSSIISRNNVMQWVNISQVIADDRDNIYLR